MSLSQDLAENTFFKVKLTTDSCELLKALRLRYDVFYLEMQGKPNHFGLDFDDFDLSSEHLVIEDKRENKIVACCRLRNSRDTTDFYSAQEFELSRFLSHPGSKVELGRVCVQKDYRNGALVLLLWRGLAEFMRRNEIQLLFGCCSSPGLDLSTASRAIEKIRSMGKFNDSYGVRPTQAYSSNPALSLKSSVDGPSGSGQKDIEISPLLQIYLAIGCEVAGTPAFDHNFNCTDFFVFLDIQNLDRKVSRKMGVLQ